MFCKYCGKEIDNNAKYCRFCSSAMNEETRIKNAICNNGTDIIKKVADFFEPLGELKKRLLVIMVLLVLNPILSLFPVFKFSEGFTKQSIYSTTNSIFDFLFEFAAEAPFIGVLIFIGLLSIVLSEFFMIFPLIKKITYKSKYLIMTKIISIIALLFFSFLLIVVFVESIKTTFIKTTFTFWGWLLILETIVLIIETYRFSSSLKKKAMQDKEIKET